MDYTAVPSEHEALHGSSPWGSSSPRAGRSTFPSNTSQSPESPQVPQHAYTGSQDGTPQSPFASQEDTNSMQPDSAVTEASEQLQNTILNPQDQPSNQQSHIPAAQQNPAASSRYHNIRPQRPVPAYRLQAKVTALERTGRKDPVIRFDIHVSNRKRLIFQADVHETNLPKFRTTQFRDVRRTHSEFVKLANHLISSNPEALVPAVPPSLTSAGAGTDEDETRVKASIQRWLNYVCGNDVLMRDEEMVFFVESDFGYSPVVRMKQPATGVRRKVLKQFAPPPDDTPELFHARPVVKLFYLATLDAGQKLDKVVKSRRGRPYF